MEPNQPYRLAFAVVTILLGVQGCGYFDRVRNLLPRDEARKSALRVGEKVFSQSDLQRFFDSRLSDFRDPNESDRVKSNLLDTFIEEKLLLSQAEQHNVAVNPKALQAMMSRINSSASEEIKTAGERDGELERSLTESLRMQKYLNDYPLKDISVPEAEIEQYYLQHLSDYIRNDEARVREILVDDIGLAEKVQASLKKNRNKNFPELARLHSKGPSASDGGDLGSFQRGELTEEFEKAIFSLTPGTVSKIVRSKYGCHLFLVEEKVLAHQQKLFEVKDRIREKLVLEREREIVKKEIQRLVNLIPVEIHRERLDFKYVGSRFPTRGGATP